MSQSGKIDKTYSERKKKILHIITKLELGGAQLNTILSAEQFTKMGYEVWIAAAQGQLSHKAAMILGDHYIELPFLCRNISVLNDLRAFISLFRLIKKLMPDIVHTHSSKAGILGRWAAWFAGCRIIIHTAHGWGFNSLQSKFVYNFFIFLERLTAKITDRIITVSDSNLEKAVSFGIGEKNKFITIRSGISEETKKIAVQRQKARDELGIRDDEFIFMSVGNFKEQKNPLASARIAVKFLKKISNAKYISVGDGPLRAQAEKIFQANEIFEDRALFLGWREDACRIMSAADALLHTAYFEGLPRTLLEACALGIPAVAAEVDGIPEIIKDGENGFLFSTDDEEGMLNALLLLHENSELRKNMSLRAKSAFTKEFTIERMFEKLDEEYRVMLEQKKYD